MVMSKTPKQEIFLNHLLALVRPSGRSNFEQTCTLELWPDALFPAQMQRTRDVPHVGERFLQGKINDEESLLILS